MSSADVSDTEITLGIGKLLGLFFGLVILCGISLGVGYSLGRNSAKQAALAAAALSTSPTSSAPSSGANKPGASSATPKTPDCATGDSNCAPQQASSPSTNDLTFYQSVQQKDDHPQLTPTAPSTPPPAPHVAEAHATIGTGFLVQIAAVRNQDDAKLLSNALQKQQYPVIIAQPGDNLFHVQVGPYADVKEAEAIRARLVSAGYNAFLKR